ncbi:hypothetical protein F4561_006276 [Lipingzhangella halophila]|uniref:Uncharacterized protein n=1 Tax=Lipingzhangella halophila TaxID=1783352 RepID=A0A7W7W5M5_9ACTN|nr:hypothetical protein [Lipingzhangella halophila]MBB4935382.1 hypothetical protein [Lipingzhangella halophila]
MAADTDDRPDFRGSTWERVLISRWIDHSVRALMVSLPLLLGGGFFFGLTHDSFPGLLSASEGTVQALGYAIGGCAGGGIAALGSTLRQRRFAEVERGIDPRRRRAARLALHRGELVDDPEANRIAASLARLHLQEGWTPLMVRIFQISAGGFATLLAVAVYFKVKYYGVDYVVTYNVFLMLWMATAAAVVLPALARTHVHSRRIVALQEAEASDSTYRGSQPRPPGSGCQVL